MIFSARLRLDYENFDSRFAFAQNDMLTLETPPPLTSIPRFQKQLAVFDVGEMIPRIHPKPSADLVTLSIPTLRVGKRGTELLCPFVTLSKVGCTVLSKGTHSKTPAASNLDEWR